MSIAFAQRRFRQFLVTFVICSLPVVAFPSAAQAGDEPEITYFAAGHLFGNWWHLYGTVADESPDSCEIYFSGLLDGYSVDVSSNGEFSLIVEIPFGQAGVVGATALDDEYLWSDTSSDYIYNY